MSSGLSIDELAARVGLRLEPFQRRILTAARGREHELLVLLPRGNGKTSLLALLAVHHLLTVTRPAVYVAAGSRDQARILWEYARDYAQALDVEDLVVRHLELRVPGGHFRALASDAPKVHGLTPSLAIVDELHAHKDGELYVALRTAMLKRPDSRLLTISTAGQGEDTPLGRLRARALGQANVTRRGPLTDSRGPGLRMLEWSLPDDADIDDPRQVKRANPASWITVPGLREQREAVPDLAYRRYHANQWTARDGSWLPPGAWQACVTGPVIEDGEPVWVGVDVGGERAATAVVWITEDLRVGADVFHGDAGVLEAVDLIRELAGRYRLREVTFDPWRFGQAAQELERERVPVVAFPQTDARMIPASAGLHSAIIDGRLALPDHPDLRQHAANAIARHSRRGWRLEAPARGENIDAMVALCMALHAVEHQPAPAQPAQVLGWF